MFWGDSPLGFYNTLNNLMETKKETLEIINTQTVTGGMTPKIRFIFNNGAEVETKGNGVFWFNKSLSFAEELKCEDLISTWFKGN